MAGKSLSADIKAYNAKVSSGQSTQKSDGNRYHSASSDKSYTKNGPQTATQHYANGRSVELDVSKLGQPSQVPSQTGPGKKSSSSKSSQPTSHFLEEASGSGQASKISSGSGNQSYESGQSSSKFSEEANKESGSIKGTGQTEDRNYLAEAMEDGAAKAAGDKKGPGARSETSATSKAQAATGPEGFAEWEAQRAAQQQHYKNYQDLLKEAEDLQREGQTHTQIWENGIYMGENKEAADEYSRKIADVQARAQAELQASGGKKGFDSFLQAAGASGASGIWSGIMNTADAAAAKLGQGVSSPDAALPFGRNEKQKEVERSKAYGDRLKAIWHGSGTTGQKIKDTVFSTYDSAVKGTSQLDLIDKSGAINNAMDLTFFLLRNWALPKITGSNDADENAAWLTGKAYGATDALTGKVADATGFDYLNNDTLQSAMENSSPAERIAATTTNIVGRMLPSILLSWVLKDPEAGLQQMAASAAGAAAKDAYLNKNATPEQAYDLGRDAGYVEYIAENMFSGVELLGKGALSEGAKEVLGDFALTKIGRAFAKAIDILGENAEEAVSDWADPGVEKAVMGSLPEGQEDITFWQALMGQMPWTEKGLEVLLSTFIMGGMSDIAQNGLRRADEDSVMEVVNIARNSGNERLAALADEYAALVERRGSMGAAKFQEFAQATAERVGEEEFARQLQEQQAANTGTETMTMFSDPATGLNADQLALAKTPDSAAMDGMKTNAASWLTAKIAGMETGESILGDYTKPDFINQLPEGAQKVALAFANTQYAEETVQNIMNYAAEIVNGNPVEWDDSRSNAAAGYALGTVSNLLQAGEQVDQKRQQAIAAESVEFALSGMSIDEAIEVANQSAQKTLTATPLSVQNAPEGAQAQERVNGQPGEENAAEAGLNRSESQAGEPKKRTRRNPGKGTVSFEGATLNGVTYKAVDKSKLTQKQKNQISAVKTLAKATGVNIVFYETEPGESGKLKGGNGAYLDGTIYLDVNAGLSEKLPDGTTVGQTAIIRTAAHELTHFIQDFAEEDYNRIKNYIVKRLAEKQGVDGLEELVAQKLARDKTGKLTPERALDEVIADGCEMMLKDTTAIEGLFRESPGLANKIRGWLKEWTRKVSDAFEGVDANHTEAKILKDSAEELQKMWDDALKNATKQHAESSGITGGVTIGDNTADDSINVGANPVVSALHPKNGSPLIKYQLRTESEPLPKQIFTVKGESRMLVDETGNNANLSVRAIRDAVARANGISAENIAKVNTFLDQVGKKMKGYELKYRFVGLKDIDNATILLDRSGNIVLSAMVKNDEYAVNFDFTKLCKKRQALQQVIETLAREKGRASENGTTEVDLSAGNVQMINEMLAASGVETNCLGCFVEAKRANQQQLNSYILDDWNSIVDEVAPDAGYFHFADAEGDVNLHDSEEDKAAFAAYREAYSRLSAELKKEGKKVTPTMNARLLIENVPAARKKLTYSDLVTERGRTRLHQEFPEIDSFAKARLGTASFKTVESFAPYNAEVELLGQKSVKVENGKLVVKKDDGSLRKELAKIGGARSQSFSDFIISHVYDVLQKTAGFAARGLPAHTYTKEISRASLFGKTGEKHNMSVLFEVDPNVDSWSAGLTKNGNFFVGDYQHFMMQEGQEGKAHFIQSIGFEDAKKLQNTDGYSKNCGIIAVPLSYRAYKKALADPDIRMIIGYHSSGMPVDVKSKTHYDMAADYQGVQNTQKVVKLVKPNYEIPKDIPSYATPPSDVKPISGGSKTTNSDMTFDIKGRFEELSAGKTGDARTAAAKQTLQEFLDFMNENGLTAVTQKSEAGYGKFALYDDVEKTRDPYLTADHYIEYCIEKGELPLFWEFATDPNYYKQLYDFNMFDRLTYNSETGRHEDLPGREAYAPQEPVHLLDSNGELTVPKDFFEQLEKFTKDYNSQMEKVSEVVPGVLEKFKNETGLKQAQMSDRDNWDDEYRSNIENSEALAQRVRDYLANHGVDSEELDEFGVNEFPSSPSRTITDAGNALNMLSDLSMDMTGKKRAEAFELMEGLLQRMDPVDRERLTGGDSKNPAFAKWYNKKHPSLYYKGYKPGDLTAGVKPRKVGTTSYGTPVLESSADYMKRERKGVQNMVKEILHLSDLLASDRLTPEDRADAQELRDRLNASLEGRASEVFYSDRDSYDEFVDDVHNEWAPEFYSKMDQTIQKQMPNKMAASQVVGWLTGKGVKKEEIRWSGIEQFLEGKKNVTKAEVQSFMEGNELNIETKTLEGNGERGKWAATGEDYGAEYDDFDDIVHDARITAKFMGLDPDQLDYWTDVGGEIVFQAPDTDGRFTQVMTVVENKAATAGTRWAEYKLAGGTNYREILFKMPGLDYKNSASEGHWREDAPGTIAHARLQDMSTTDGKRMLFIEEIQSDLHNAGAAKRDRDTGRLIKEEHFASEEEQEYQRIAKMGSWKRSEEEESRLKDLTEKLLPSEKPFIDAKAVADGMQEDVSRAVIAINKRVEELARSGKVAPDGFYGYRPELIAKWFKNNVGHSAIYDYFVWKNNPFYNTELKPLVEDVLENAITAEERDILNRYAEAAEKSARLQHEYFTERRRVRAEAPPDVPFAGSADTYHEYVMKHLLRLAAEGQYDAIGWTTSQQQVDRWSDEFEEGYRIEYDQDLPKFMNKYTKQWGGKVRAMELDNGEEVWGVVMMPGMYEDVLNVGQPMFSERDEETGGSSGADVIDILTNPTGENGQLSNSQVDKIVGDPDAFQQFLQATGLQASDVDRSSKSNTRRSVKEAAAQYLADAATARRADELGRQADEWNKAHENDEREEEFDGVGEKNWDRFWDAAHKGYDALVNLIAKDAKNMADYMRIFKDATGEDMSNDPDVLRKQLQDLANDSTADAITGKPLVSPEEINTTDTGLNGTETKPAQNGKRLNWNAPGSSSPQTSQYYSGTLTKTGEAVDLDETDYQYVPITERESIRRAAAKVGNNPDQVLKELYGSRVWLSEQVDAAYIIKGYLRSKALATDSKEDWAAYKTFTKLVQERATESGRSLQAFAKQSRPSAGALLDTIEAEVDRIRRDAESRRSRWKVSPEQIAEVEKKGHALATRLAKLENQYDELVESGVNKKRAWQRVKGDYVKMASEIAAERMVGLMSDAGKNSDIRNNVRRGVRETTTLLEKMLDSMDEDYIRKYVALSAAGITEDVKYKGKLSAEKVSRYVNTLHKQGMLASVPTTLRNLEGNTVFGTVDWAANNTAGAAMDALFGFFTGERTRGMEWGVLDPRVAKAAKTEMVKSILEIAANIDLYDTPRDSKYGTSGQYSANPYGNIGSRILMRAEQGLKYALESTDAFFVGASKASAGMAATRANARRGGSMTEKTAEAIGKNEAEFRTFKNVTPIQEFLQGLRGLIDLIGFGGEITNWGGTKIPIRKGGFGLGTLTVPFIGVPVNIAIKAAEYSPINAALGIRTAMKMANTYADAKKTGDAELYQKALMLQNQAAGQIGRGVFGSVLVTLLMAAMKRAKKNDREFYKDWNLEENADVRAQNKAEGKYGQQVNVSMLMRHLLYGKDRDPGGWGPRDLAVNISANEPMDQFLTMASMLADDDDAPDILDLIEAAGKGTLDSIMDLSCVASINEFINTINYNPVYKTEEETVNGETVEKEVVDKRATRVNAAAAMLAKSLSGFVPAASRHAAAASDEYQRDTRGDTAIESAWNQILNSIPGKHGRESLPVKMDNFGNEIRTGDLNTRLANTYLANSYSRVNQSRESAELERLREETGEVLLPPRNPPRTVTYGSGKDQTKVRLTADEGRDFHKTRGGDYKSQLRQLFDSSEYKAADSDTQKAMVKALKSFSNDNARTELADDHGIQYESKYADARKLDDPTMSVSLKAGYSNAAKDDDWSAIDDMTKAAQKLSAKDREYLGKADNFNIMYDMNQKGTGSEKVNWYQEDTKARADAAGKTAANGYDIFQSVVSGVKKGVLTTKDADNFMNRKKSDGSYYAAKGRHSVYQGMRDQNYSPAEALDAWDKMDSNGDGTLAKKEFDNALRKYNFKNEREFKDSVYKANGWGKYRKK